MMISGYLNKDGGVSHCLLHVVSHFGIVHASPLLLLTGLGLLPLCQHPGNLGTAEQSSD